MDLHKPFDAEGARSDAGGAPFVDFLDELTEARCNVAASNGARLEPRVARLELIVQRLLLGLVEAAQREKQ
jgi:hypothetical protein